jgi:uncharacterized protein YbbK (DUF523 family)
MSGRKPARIIVSACLAGMETNYLGEAWPNAKVMKLVREGKAMPVCPEQLGGLSTPRTPAERIGNSIKTREGSDVTPQFKKGAEEVARLIKLTGAEVAILKSRSPSCGVGCTYDGSFSDTLVDRDGVTAEVLRKMGVKLLTEENL